MKRAIILFAVIAMVIFSTVLWLTNSDAPFKPADLVEVGIILLVVGFAVIVLYKRVVSAKRGEPVEDELSKRVMQKAAAFSYFISIYIWVGVLFIKDRVKLDTEQLIGGGILGMALVFAILWMIFNFRGVKNE
jgi:peptidoglycan/LPS O-acetylase OafA/YrhL